MVLCGNSKGVGWMSVLRGWVDRRRWVRGVLEGG